MRFFFLEGTGLDDPRGRLEGSGSQVRSIRLDAHAAVLDDAYIPGLIAQAVKQSGADLKSGTGRIVLQSRPVSR